MGWTWAHPTSVSESIRLISICPPQIIESSETLRITAYLCQDDTCRLLGIPSRSAPRREKERYEASYGIVFPIPRCPTVKIQSSTIRKTSRPLESLNGAAQKRSKGNAHIGQVL